MPLETVSRRDVRAVRTGLRSANVTFNASQMTVEASELLA